MVLKNMTQSDLAKRAGCTQPTISRVLRGVQTPNVETFLRICDAMGVEPKGLYEEIKGRAAGAA